MKLKSICLSASIVLICVSTQSFAGQPSAMPLPNQGPGNANAAMHVQQAQINRNTTKMNAVNKQIQSVNSQMNNAGCSSNGNASNCQQLANKLQSLQQQSNTLQSQIQKDQTMMKQMPLQAPAPKPSTNQSSY